MNIWCSRKFISNNVRHNCSLIPDIEIQKMFKLSQIRKAQYKDVFLSFLQKNISPLKIE